jgi:ring-1,2-phenylacetyl-CoA epoxidase subunit PaaE
MGALPGAVTAAPGRRHHVVFHPLVVSAVEEVTDDSVAITFAVPDDLRADYAWTPGQHLTIRGDDDVRRSFSICTPPASGMLRIGVKRLPGGAFSEGVVGDLQPGDTLEVMTPAGSFTHVPDPTVPRRYVAIAAGSGITPVLSIVGAVLESEPDASVTLLYANRTHRSVMFLDEVHDLKDRFPQRFQLLHVLSREDTEVELLSGRLDAERLGRILDSLVPADEVDAWFVCGPQQMVVELREALTGRGVPRDRVHTELFHAEPVQRATVAALEGAADGAAEVTIRLDGRASTFPLRPDGPPVLEAALAVRSDLPFACKGGVCGTCRARVVEGSVAMDVNYALEPEEVERGYVLTCQSHPTSGRLVVDYDA